MPRICHRLILSALALLAAPATAGAATVQELEREGVRDIIVQREPGLTAAERTAVRADAGVGHVRMMRLANTEVVRAPAGRLAEALAVLHRDPDVRAAEPDAPVRALTNDTFWDVLWGLENTGQLIDGDVAGNPDADIDAPTAWTVSTGAGVTVAVVDTGVQADHPDLAGQLTGNPGEQGAKATNGIDDDGNGRVDDARGWDFVDGDNVPQDGDGHGTHVAGTVAAQTGNGIGVAGVAPDAKVLPLRVLDDDGGGNMSDVADAFDYAGDLGIRVVNASLGGEEPSSAVAAVVSAHPGTLFVVAAGNDGRDNESVPAYPCNLAHANILCVGATDATDLRASFSNYGATSVDLFAPGELIGSTSPGNAYVYLDGTSMASPHAAGAAALVAAAQPSFTSAQVKNALMTSVDAKSLLAPRSVSGGRLNAARALGIAQGDGGDGGGEGPPGGVPSEDQDADQPSEAPAPAPVAPVTTLPDDPQLDEELEEPAAPPSLRVRRRGVATLCLRGCATRTFELRYTLEAPARVRTTYERRVCGRRGCAWRAVARRTLKGRPGTNRLKVGTKVGRTTLKRGRHRVTLRVETAAGVSTGRLTFTVR